MLAALLLLQPSGLLKLVGLHEQAEKIQVQFLTHSRWVLLQAIISGLVVIWLGVGLLLHSLTSVLASLSLVVRLGIAEACTIVGGLVRQVQVAPLPLQAALLGLFTLLVGSQTYQAAFFPLSYDEIWTYLNFSSRGPLVALAYYPAPNNHVLYSLLSSLTVLLAPESALGLRLPAIIASGLAFWLLFALLLRHSALLWALCGLFLFYSSYIVFYYSFLARGYEFQLLAFIGSLGAVMELRNPHSRYRTAAWLGFIIFSTIGLTTIPTYVYPLVSEFLFLGLVLFTLGPAKEWLRILQKMLLVGMLIASITVLFYAPILIFSGPARLFNNKFVIPIERSEVLRLLIHHLRDTLDWFFISSLTQYLLIVLAALSLFAAAVKPKLISRMWQLGLFFVLPALFMLFQAVIPFPRTWIYLMVVLVLLICCLPTFGTWDWARQQPKLVSYGLLLSAISIWTVSTYLNQARFHSEHDDFFSYSQVYTQVLDVAPNRQLLIESDHADVMLEYQYRLHHRPYTPLRAHTGQLPAQVWLVEDKRTALSEVLRSDSTGCSRTIYDDTFVRVREIIAPAINFNPLFK